MGNEVHGLMQAARKLHAAMRPLTDEAPTLTETLFPWQVRLVIFLGGWSAALVWRSSPIAVQGGWTLAYGGAIAVSLAISAWWLILLADSGVALLWLGATLLPPFRRREHPAAFWLLQAIELANRQIAHVETFWIFMALAMSSAPRIDVQVPLLLALILFGGSFLTVVTRSFHPTAQRRTGELQSRRRSFVHLATAIGFLVLTLRTLDGQIVTVVPLTTALALPTLIRYLRQRRRQRDERSHADAIQEFRSAQRGMTRTADVAFGPVLTLLGVAALAAASIWTRTHLDGQVAAALDGPAAAEDTCERDPGGPVTPTVKLFVLADSQLHELGGERFPGQSELADVLVPSAVRPVELDVLSAVPLRHFARVLRGLGPDVLWAQLGDLADMGCVGEMERAAAALRDFPTDRLAGIAPGNHDMSFTGNFIWSPFWSGACPSGRMDKATSLSMMPAGQSSKEVTSIFGTPQARVTLTRLGSVRHRGVERALVALFLDTADRAATDWGIAGLFGTFSSKQAAATAELVRALPRDSDPIFLVFTHHPLSDMTGSSAGRLLEVLGWLDDDPLGRARGDQRAIYDHDPRVLALVAAHTHHAESHRVRVGFRALRELVVGSTIDPPQQAALLEVGSDARGRAALRLRTLPTVAREGSTCGEVTGAVSAASCQALVAAMAGEPSCARLLESEADCGALEAPLSTGDKLARLAHEAVTVTPTDILADQTRRTRLLLECVAPGDGEKHLLTGEKYAELLAPKLADDASAERLDCLAWAASAVQSHKAAGMTFSDALRCAFDDPTIPAAKELVVALEATPCR